MVPRRQQTGAGAGLRVQTLHVARLLSPFKWHPKTYTRAVPCRFAISPSRPKLHHFAWFTLRDDSLSSLAVFCVAILSYCHFELIPAIS